MLYVPKWWVVSWRPCRWNVTAENCPCPVFVTHANHCLSCSFFSPGTSGISLSHNFYSGSIFKSNSIWTSLSSQRLPPQWLEFTRFYNCGSRVSTCIMSVNALYTLGHWEPLGAWRHMRVGTSLISDVRGCYPSFPLYHMFYQALLHNLKIQLIPAGHL